MLSGLALVIIRIARVRRRPLVATAFAATIDAMASIFAWADQQLRQLSSDRRIPVSQIRSPLVNGATPQPMPHRNNSSCAARTLRIGRARHPLVSPQAPADLPTAQPRYFILARLTPIIFDVNIANTKLAAPPRPTAARVAAPDCSFAGRTARSRRERTAVSAARVRNDETGLPLSTLNAALPPDVRKAWTLARRIGHNRRRSMTNITSLPLQPVQLELATERSDRWRDARAGGVKAPCKRASIQREK
jgi:hypothetical protein